MAHNILSIAEFSKKHQSFSDASIRWIFFQAKKENNPYTKMLPAFTKLGKRIFIDEELFFELITSNE